MLGRRSRHAVAIAVFCALPAAPAQPAQAAPAQSKAAQSRAVQSRAVAARPRTGTVIARIQIRRMGLKSVVRQGVGEAVLRRGVGHYPGTALPGREGNTVLLGHRTTWRHPFGKLDRMRRGDRIVLRAGRRTYVYRVRLKRVIGPRNRRVLEPVPFRSRSAPDGRYVTLITCTPKGSDRRRLVVVGKIAAKR